MLGLFGLFIRVLLPILLLLRGLNLTGPEERDLLLVGQRTLWVDLISVGFKSLFKLLKRLNFACKDILVDVVLQILEKSEAGLLLALFPAIVAHVFHGSDFAENFAKIPVPVWN